ncbi:toll/interleukin-1 receptor domain-containing protein [Streptomyces blattellae]|uniref:toll/interleukin-1 receptor domain-containing protein n=1 Tax=Streptomyces blattellae TaxID=2569855 RepID=UPI0012B6FCCE|nr:toll/interleukin-1 receptor domain-containing protein [Streptomyces blattellae]
MTTTTEPVPLVFIGHVADDRDAFVEPLARELAERGVKAWVEFWEVRLGDSLTGPVFTDGVDEADCFALVLSPLWHEKPWLREQLDATAHRRVQDRRTLIPVLLDGVQAPPSLRHLRALSCPRSPEGAATAARRIADLLYGVDPRPVVTPRPGRPYPGLGPDSPPTRAAPQASVPHTARRPAFPGLADAEVGFLQSILAVALREGRLGPLPWAEVGAALPETGPDPATASRTLARLERSGLVRSGRVGEQVAWCELTDRGYRLTASRVVPDLDDAERRLVLALARRERPPGTRSRGRDTAELAEAAGTHVLVADRFLADLEQKGHVTVLRGGGRTLVTDVDPALGSWARELGEEQRR